MGDLNFLEKKKPAQYNCVIAVDERGDGFLVKSEPSLYEHELFDGNSLQDSIQNKKDIPKECGIYRCRIMVSTYKSYTDMGHEYDVNILIDGVVKIELPINAVQ